MTLGESCAVQQFLLLALMSHNHTATDLISGCLNMGTGRSPSCVSTWTLVLCRSAARWAAEAEKLQKAEEEANTK